MKRLDISAIPRDYQAAFHTDAIDQLQTPGSYLYASPTGTGKSIKLLRLHDHLNAIAATSLLITPRLEIITGMLAEGGIDATGFSDAKLAEVALDYGITTPIRARNMLSAGTLPFRPRVILWDEAHHRAADSYEDIRAYCGGGTSELGLTASPFRGTPKGTEAFLESWKSLTWVLTYPEAAARGVISVPTCEVWPLIDDDEIEVTNGEIVVKAAGEAVTTRADEVAERCRKFSTYRTLNAAGEVELPARRAWDRPTLFAVPTTDAARDVAAALRRVGLPAEAVTQDTPRAERNRLFAALGRAEVAVVQIDVVSEGVNLLTLRRLIDLRPTLSPVKWLQQVGRITRPTKRCGDCEAAGYFREHPPCRCEPPAEYICCNRNLERHCYLYDGLIPPKAVAAAQVAFTGPSKRFGTRAIGQENLGRFKAAELPLADGTIGLMYQVAATDGFKRREYTVLLHPCNSTPLYAYRENERGEGDHVKYGTWKSCSGLPDLRGFASAGSKQLSEKQAAWWARSAGHFGLDPKGKVNRRSFAALPVLVDTGMRLKGAA